ncbi:MAG: ABC transporter substrate-binding protein [Nitrospira sp. SB0666_bin_27]|nr:ABC transporter substrate-binding protein [Nitrospira sp. SB0666_bin_27]MYF25049.1 ABC transporter substrate-binding protein [Nitrospira sp. SB0678_bin_10]
MFNRIPSIRPENPFTSIREIVKAVIILKRLCALLLIVLVAACTGPASDAFRFGLAGAPANLDPRFATDATSARINRLLYDRLVDFNDTFEPVPALADWEQLSPTHYRFHLKTNEHPFHDGTMLTAHDVKATYDFILNADNASPHRASLTVINRIAVPSETSLDFFLHYPEPLFPGYLVIGIVPAHLIAANHPLHERPIGSGPFSFLARPDETRLHLLRIRDQRRFEFITVPDPTVRALKLMAGEIDMLQNDLPPELIGYLENDSRLKVLRTSGTNFSYLGFSFDDAVTRQAYVRRAIAHAINRREIIQYVLDGAARPAQSLLPPEHWAGAQDLDPITYDPEKARTLLHQAGYSRDDPVRIVYKTSSDPFRIRLATILQHQLKSVGIDVDLRSYDWGTFYGDIKAGRFQMYSLAWVGIHTPDIFDYVFHSRSIPPNGANRGRFRSTQADAFIDRARAAPNLETKQESYLQLQHHLADALPYVPLWYEDHIFIARREIEGFTMARDGNYDGLIHVRRSPPDAF